VQELVPGGHAGGRCDRAAPGERDAYDRGDGDEDAGDGVGGVEGGAQRLAVGAGHGEPHGKHGEDQECADPVQRLLGAGVSVGGGGRLLHGSSRSFVGFVAGSASRLAMRRASVSSRRSCSCGGTPCSARALTWPAKLTSWCWISRARGVK